MQAEIAPPIAGPGGSTSGHGFVSGREAMSMMKDFQSTQGDLKAVAKSAAKNTLTYNQEFIWAMLLSPMNGLL